jgi:hypothetical protein
MDEFLVYGDDFEDALNNLEKVIIRCLETNIALSDAKLKELCLVIMYLLQ